MTHATDEQLELLDEIEDRAEDAKSEGTLEKDWQAQEAARDNLFRRQFALDKAVQVARVALAHNRISESNAADFTVSAADKFFAYLNQN